LKHDTARLQGARGVEMIRRNRFVIAATGLLALGAGQAVAQEARGVAGVGSSAQPARGSLVFEEEKVDLGTITDGEKIEIEFPFRNVGSSPITIIRSKPSCGCTLTKTMENEVFQPGESGVIEAIFDPTGKKGRTSVRVTVETDDPVRPVTTLSLTAEVESIIRVDPVMVQFEDVRKGESKTITLELTGEMDGLKALFATATDSTKIGTEVVETWVDERNGKSKTSIDVTLKPQMETGQVRERIYIRTNDPRRRLVEVKTLARIVGDLHASPNRMGLGLIVPGQPFSKNTRITHRGGESFEIVNATVQFQNVPEGVLEVETEIVPAQDMPEGTAYDVIIKGSPAENNTQRRAVRGRLLIETDVPGEEALEILLYGSMRSIPNIPVQSREDRDDDGR